MGLLAVPRAALAKPEPAARHEEPLVAIHIEALLGGPALGAGAGLELGVGELVLVRQHVALDFDGPGVGVGPGDWRGPWLGRVPGHEGIPRFNGASVEQKPKPGPWALNQPVENHCHVALDAIDQVIEIVGLVARCHDAVQHFPQNQRSGLSILERSQQRLRSVSGPLEKQPTAVRIGGQSIEVPAQARARAGLG